MHKFCPHAPSSLCKSWSTFHIWFSIKIIPKIIWKPKTILFQNFKPWNGRKKRGSDCNAFAHVMFFGLFVFTWLCMDLRWFYSIKINCVLCRLDFSAMSSSVEFLPATSTVDDFNKLMGKANTSMRTVPFTMVDVISFISNQPANSIKNPKNFITVFGRRKDEDDNEEVEVVYYVEREKVLVDSCRNDLRTAFTLVKKGNTWPRQWTAWLHF